MPLRSALLALLLLPQIGHAQPGVEVGLGRLEGVQKYLTTGVIGGRLTSGPYRWTVRYYRGTRCGIVGCAAEGIEALTGTMTFGVRHGTTTVYLGGGGGLLDERWIFRDPFGTGHGYRRTSIALPAELGAEVTLRRGWAVFVRGVALTTLKGLDEPHRSLMFGIGR